MPTTKIGENTTNILKLLFFTINLHFVTSNQISTYSSIYFLFLPLEMQKKKRLEQAKKYTTRLLNLKRNDLQAFKSKSCGNTFLQCICYWCKLLPWMFFNLRDNWKTKKWMLLWDFLKQHVAAFFEASVLKEVCILCVISTITIWY